MPRKDKTLFADRRTPRAVHAVPRDVQCCSPSLFMHLLPPPSLLPCRPRRFIVYHRSLDLCRPLQRDRRIQLRGRGTCPLNSAGTRRTTGRWEPVEIRGRAAECRLSSHAPRDPRSARSAEYRDTSSIDVSRADTRLYGRERRRERENPTRSIWLSSRDKIPAVFCNTIIITRG